MAAQANAVSILAITVLIVYEGIRRLIHPEGVSGGIVIVVAAGAAVANLAAALALRETHAHAPGETHDHKAEGDLNMRSARVHMAGDTLASIGVAAAGAVILFSGRFDRLDPIVSMAIGLLIAWQAWKLLRASAEVHLESTPAGLHLDRLTAAIEAVHDVDAVHDLHVWSLSSEVRALSAHIVLAGHPSLEEAQVIGERAKQAAIEPFRIAHATFELECESCSDEGDFCAIDAEANATRATAR